MSWCNSAILRDQSIYIVLFYRVHCIIHTQCTTIIRIYLVSYLYADRIGVAELTIFERCRVSTGRTETHSVSSIWQGDVGRESWPTSPSDHREEQHGHPATRRSSAQTRIVSSSTKVFRVYSSFITSFPFGPPSLVYQKIGIVIMVWSSKGGIESSIMISSLLDGEIYSWFPSSYRPSICWVGGRFSGWRIWTVTSLLLGYPFGYTKIWYCNMIWGIKGGMESSIKERIL